MELGRLAISLPAPFLPARACVELGRRAETEWGYPAIWLAETNGPDSFSLAGALATVTERVTIGTAIVPVYNRSPAVLAMSAGTLAELSGDRFVLGQISVAGSVRSFSPPGRRVGAAARSFRTRAGAARAATAAAAWWAGRLASAAGAAPSH